MSQLSNRLAHHDHLGTKLREARDIVLKGWEGECLVRPALQTPIQLHVHIHEVKTMETLVNKTHVQYSPTESMHRSKVTSLPQDTGNKMKLYRTKHV